MLHLNHKSPPIWFSSLTRGSSNRISPFTWVLSVASFCILKGGSVMKGKKMDRDFARKSRANSEKVAKGITKRNEAFAKGKGF